MEHRGVPEQRPQDFIFYIVHCTDALLLGSHFTEVTVSNITLRLNQAVRDLVVKASFFSTESIKFMQRPSSNVADYSNDSIKVLREVLESFGEVLFEPIEKKDIVEKDEILDAAIALTLSVADKPSPENFSAD